MTTKRWLFLVLSFAPTAWLACSSSSPAISDQTVGTDSGADSDATSDGTVTPSDSGDHDGAAQDGAAAADGNVADADADAGQFTGPPPGDASCDPSATWGTGTLLAASTATDDLLDAITPDELTVAWTAGPAGAKVVYYADRTSASDPFAAPQDLDATLMVAAGTYTADRVALSPDGLRIIVVNADSAGFSEATRIARTGAGSTFGSLSEGSFSNINAATPSGASVGDPVVGSSDTSFYFSVYNAGSTSTVFRALRLLSSDAWDEGAAVNAAAGLLAQGSLRRRPTGISSDGRTLFFFDEVSSTERASWINETTGSFDSFADLGARTWAAPASGCGTLYYSAAGTSSIDLFTATH